MTMPTCSPLRRGRKMTAVALCCGWLVACAAAQTVPANLPKPDAKLPATDKPVKIYILSGQSNSLGFGRANGGSPTFPSIFLSADPSIKTGAMPIGTSGLLPMRIYRDAEGKQRGASASVLTRTNEPGTDRLKSVVPSSVRAVALGDASAELPSVVSPSTLQVTAYIEVPITGMHEVHIGTGDSSYALATINGKEVYRKEVGGEAKITKTKLERGKRHPLDIIYTKGGSAALWMELVDLKPKGTLEYHIKEHGRFTCLVDEKGEWNTRNDVMFCDAYMGKGKNGPLGALWRGGSFGPELGFGYVMGTFHDEPVIVMKADIGNRSLAWDCLPPGSQRYEAEVTERDGTKKTYIYAGYKDGQSRWPKEQGEPKTGGWYAGKQYDDYTAAIHNVLDNFDKFFPQYKDQGYEVAGFVWWQGHKDQNDVHASRYEQNLVNLIKAWRKEFNAPKAKFAIATIAFGGWDLSGPGKQIAEAQLAVGSGKYPEFKGNVKTIEARDFWRDPGESPKNQGYHYNHNGETYFLVGDALGRAMVEMQGGKAEKRQLPPRPEKPESWPADPTLEQAVQMLYSDAFISPWAEDPAEPTAEDFKKMAPALRPIIMDKMVPAYAKAAQGVPAYRRRGGQLMPIVTGEAPKDPGSTLYNQLDTIVDYYRFAGVEGHEWVPFGPDMRLANWEYFTFDPAEPFDPKKVDRYRKITYPKGMANWNAVDFDAAAAGWKTGASPFGQNNGELKPLRSHCGNPQCRCDTMPGTLWDEEVLLMRQSFDVPAFKDGHRYRLVVGGGNHTWAGEGFAVYVNGKLFLESTGGFYKKGGTSGGYIYNDFRPEFDGKKVTIAVKAFLRQSGHRGKAAPPRGHISVWLEEIKLPPAVLQLGEQE
jgi:hypothetical protein